MWVTMTNSNYHIDDIISLANEIKKSDDGIFISESFELISKYISANENKIFKPIALKQDKVLEYHKLSDDLAEFAENSAKKRRSFER